MEGWSSQEAEQRGTDQKGPQARHNLQSHASMPHPDTLRGNLLEYSLPNLD